MSKERALSKNLGDLLDKVEWWESFCSSVVTGEQQHYDDYLNDMDRRDILADSIAQLEPLHIEELMKRIANADQLLKAGTIATTNCIWGNDVAIRAGWNATDQWWYYRKPTNCGEDWPSDDDY